MKKSIYSIFSFSILFIIINSMEISSANYNAFGLKYYTIENSHFIIHYEEDLDIAAERVGNILSELYDIYKNHYNITLPNKTKVIVENDDRGSWALTLTNTIHISLRDIDFVYRGTNDNLRDAVAHEYAHIVSISASYKMPPWLPYLQFGFFSHPNNMENNKGMRLEAFHIFPNEILPPWFFEGIAQYESTLNDGDSWDSHRDMILRTLTLTDRLLTWDHMSVFTGRGDDYEKTYNHGFSLVKYIAETYGRDKIAAIIREAAEFGRVNFDRAIESVLGIKGRKLYKEWTLSLKNKYTKDLKEIGTQVYGRKISKIGYENIKPQFGPGGNKVYFLSNGKHDYAYSFKSLYSYDFSDTLQEDKKIKIEMPQVKWFYDINNESGHIFYTSRKSRKSRVKPQEGGSRVSDIFIDSLPDENKSFFKSLFLKRSEKQVTFKKRAYCVSSSPDGKMAAFSRHIKDRDYLCITDTSGNFFKTLYPEPGNDSSKIRTIFSIDWSPAGNTIALSYADSADRKIAVFDTSTGSFLNVCDTEFDERDPSFSLDGKYLYFSSNRTGIFNIYRYDMENELLQRVTNVTGGAFDPDVSTDGEKLVCSMYDSSGFSIYLLDSIKVLEEKPVLKENAFIPRDLPDFKIKDDFTSPDDYNSFPRQTLIIPTMLTEQVLNKENNVFKGLSHTKYGFVFNIMDPLEWTGKGNSIGGFFLTEVGAFHKLINFDTKGLNRNITFDQGLFFSTHKLPFDLDFSQFQRGIHGKDLFNHDYYGNDTLETMDYNINPSYYDLVLTHQFNRAIAIHLLGGYDKYNVWIIDPPGYNDNGAYSYTPSKGSRIGGYFTFMNKLFDTKMSIAPKGLFAKIKYEFWSRKMQNEIYSFKIDGGAIKERYLAPYEYNLINADIKYGRYVPCSDNQSIKMDFNFTSAKLTNSSKKRLKTDVNNGYITDTDLPSYMEPAAWIPGYAYYIRDTVEYYLREKGDSTRQYYFVPSDSVLISGNNVLYGNLSYLFPLYPGPIDKKLSFIYLDHLFGAINFGGGTAASSLSDFKNLSRNDFLLYAGAEIRLEAQSFNRYPLAISARWDWGFDRPAPVGGHRFTLNIGFSFDRWDIISEPDGRRSPVTSSLLSNL